MTSDAALSKRINRRVSGRNHQFIAVTAPGFEKICYDELISLPLSKHDQSIVTGGVEFQGRIHDCYLANLYLRSSNRILMRIGKFKATSFRALEKKTG